VALRTNEAKGHFSNPSDERHAHFNETRLRSAERRGGQPIGKVRGAILPRRPPMVHTFDSLHSWNTHFNASTTPQT